MTIHTQIKEDKASTDVSLEIETDSISISLGDNTSGINIIFNGGRITAYIYTSTTPDPEVITLTTV